MTRTGPLGSVLTRAEIEDLATVYLAGRAADLTLGRGSHSGAAMDIEMARTILVQACCAWGLYGTAGHTDPGSEEVTIFLERTIKRLLARALRLLADHRDALADLADVLVERRFLKAQEVHAMLVLPAPAGKIQRRATGATVTAAGRKTNRTKVRPASKDANRRSSQLQAEGGDSVEVTSK